MQNNDHSQLFHARRMYERVKAHGYDYNHPSFNRPIPKRVGMQDTLFGCYQSSPWLLWMFRNRAWKDDESRKKIIKILWEKRKEWYGMLTSMRPEVKDEYLNVLCNEIYLKPEYKQRLINEN